MKTLITLIFVLIIGITARAQNPNSVIEVKTVSTTIVVPASSKEIMIKNEKSVSVIYIYKNYKIKRALSFSTKNDKAKLA